MKKTKSTNRCESFWAAGLFIVQCSHLKNHTGQHGTKIRATMETNQSEAWILWSDPYSEPKLRSKTI
jgi:hypothetical protein